MHAMVFEILDHANYVANAQGKPTAVVPLYPLPSALAGLDPQAVMRVVEAAKTLKSEFDRRDECGEIVMTAELFSALAALGGKEAHGKPEG